jgi:hypothetical protein
MIRCPWFATVHTSYRTDDLALVLPLSNHGRAKRFASTATIFPLHLPVEYKC